MDNLIKSFGNSNVALGGALITGALLVLLANKYIQQTQQSTNSNNNKLKKIREYPIRVQKIIIYPIKSCRGIELTHGQVDKIGFVNDRKWMLIHNNRFMSQRTTPKLALITPRFEGENLVISAPGMPDLFVPININAETTPTMKATIWKHEVNVLNCGEESHEWFSKFMEKDVSLVQVPRENYNRQVEYVYLQNIKGINAPSDVQTSDYQFRLCDAGQIMFLGQASIDELNQRINEERAKRGEKQQAPLTWERFRPNLLITGTEAFEEDDWSQFRIGSLQFASIDHTGRCKLTTVEPSTGVLNPYEDDEPLRTLKTFRKAVDNSVYLGVLGVRQDGSDLVDVSVGDIIEVLSNDFVSKNHSVLNSQ
ncbi:molybdenum cofactor sulfurase domain-containing protein [Tieghemostelium lacteum]|uniref:Molybdenum cofactor sulfurase domain-containing protein n=1 Tax=Tieghemostelium lacteum TaxID=361077 RepID=A0A151ZJG1_TIELA|nr:molybdenum cofactor sulfurase domain-containing protein [Tieghemostelium lacteum]|eukprot:KYQ94020.1 molybdenum cofactor sulfurase domain-containing protein [Tieghemostelium lacteum]